MGPSQIPDPDDEIKRCAERQRMSPRVPRTRCGVEHADQNIAGIGFAGVEPYDGFQRYTRAAAFVRAHDLLVVPHIGEKHGPAAIRSALAAMRPHRIAHGVRAAADPGLLDRLAEDGIVCDLCPTSNVRLGVTASLENHPLTAFVRHGVPTTLNVDDPLLFATTLSQEYTEVARVLSLPVTALAALAAGGMQASGMTADTRQRLQLDIQQWLTNVSSTTKGR